MASSTWCTEIKESIENDSTWTPTIYIPTTKWSKEDAKSNSFLHVHEDIVYVDIVQLLTPSSELMQKIEVRHKSIKRPIDAVFQFENFYSYQDKNDVIKFINTNALIDGTNLIVQRSKNGNGRKDITLSCDHYGIRKNKKSHLKFNDNCLQAVDTVINPAHGRSKVYKLAHNRSINPKKNIRKYKSQTKKIGCHFSFVISFYEPLYKWFLRRKRINCKGICHINHLQIPGDYKYLSKDIIPEKIMECIHLHLQEGTPVKLIERFIKVQFKKNISYHTIYKIFTDNLTNQFDVCCKNASKSSVDKLISLFETYKNVSYVYLIHKYDSGFVTYRKSPKTKNLEKELNLSHDIGVTEENIKSWRDELKLKNSNNILVGFAWAHDEELRHTEMFPEFFGLDVTFGVNTEKREELVVAGVDGNNKVFTSFRCFMPSKQEKAYSWVIKEAMPFLLSEKVLKYTSCIASDQEPGIISAVDSGINSIERQSFKFTKHRLDYYHLVMKDWKNNIQTSYIKSNTENKKTLSKMLFWIKSWFTYCESHQEFKISYKFFKSFLQRKQSELGYSCCEEINNLLVRLGKATERIYHYHFCKQTTFDFIGDSIAEVANHKIKHGINPVVSTMTLDRCGYNQLVMSDAEKKKKAVFNHIR